jgi:hypothetical protein
MSRGIKCRLILNGSSRQIDMGIFDSIAKAKQYVSECWNRPYSIIKLK